MTGLGVTPDFGFQFAMTGLFQGIGRGFLGLLGRQAATVAGEELVGLYGKVSIDAIESAAASGGPTVQVFTRLTGAPAVGKALSTATDEAGALAARTTGQLYRAEIPRALLEQLKRSGLAIEKTLEWKGAAGATQVSKEIQILPQAARFGVDYFK